MRTKPLLLLVIAATTATLAIASVVPVVRAVQPDASQDAASPFAFDADGLTRVIVRVAADVVPQAPATPAAEALDHARIAVAQSAAIGALRGTRHRVVRVAESAPFVSLEVDAHALAVLRSSPLTANVQPIHTYEPQLNDSTEIVDSVYTTAVGLRGTGATVAIVDSGVDRYHGFLRGAVVEEACFSSGLDCPNGSYKQTGPGSAAPCAYSPAITGPEGTFLSRCGHGTHVAGIAVGRGGIFDGVAKDATVMAVQVFSKSTTCDWGDWEWSFDPPDACPVTDDDAVADALDHIYSRRNVHRIAAVNLSLGGRSTYTSRADCEWEHDRLKWSIDRLRSVGIATIASSGNEGTKDAMGSPACISSAVSVGATNKSDEVLEMSNSASFLDLLAPGGSIRSSEPGGTFGVRTGTSMAVPHVTGAWAVLKSMAPEATVDRVLAAFKATGKPIVDEANDVMTRRIDVRWAVESLGTIRIDDVTATEGTTYAVFPVTLAKTYPVVVSVWYRTLNGTASSPNDFGARSGRIDFQPGQTRKYINVPIVDDAAYEGAETFTVELTTSYNANRNRSRATGTIPRNDLIGPTRPTYDGPDEVQR